MSTGIETDDIIEPWLWDRLNGDPTLAAMVGAVVNASTEESLTDLGTSYVVFSFASARDVRGVGTTRVQVDSIYLVKAVVKGQDYAPARDIMKRVDALLGVDQTVSTSTGDLTCTRETIVKYPERQDGQSFRHLGGTYRIRANST